MNATDYFQSLSQEFVAVKNRVRHFIDDHHWLTDGEWKEAILREYLRKHLPSSIKVGRGFVISQAEPSKQIDVLLYDATKPVLFQDADLVFITPNAVRGIIEVKTSIDNLSYKECVDRLILNLDFIRRNQGRAFTGIFAYESSVSDFNALRRLQEVGRGHDSFAINLVCLGENHLIHYWYLDPILGRRPILRWHLYQMQRLSFGYFLHNCIHQSDPQAMAGSETIWFPSEGKEMHKIGEAGLDLAIEPTLTPTAR